MFAGKQPTVEELMAQNFVSAEEIEAGQAEEKRVAAQEEQVQKESASGMKRLIRAAKTVANSPDRRVRPDGISSNEFAMVRQFKATETAKIKKKGKKRKKRSA